MSTFRDRLALSAEWDGSCYIEADVSNFLDQVIECMTSVVRGSEDASISDKYISL